MERKLFISWEKRAYHTMHSHMRKYQIWSGRSRNEGGASVRAFIGFSLGKTMQGRVNRLGLAVCKIPVGSGFRGWLCLSDTSLWEAFQQGTYWICVWKSEKEMVGTRDLGLHVKGYAPRQVIVTIVNYSWPLTNMNLKRNCTGPLIHGFFSINTYYSTIWFTIVESADAEP